MTFAARHVLGKPAAAEQASYDLHIILGYATAAVVVLFLIYAASAPGTAANDLAVMSSFP
jgi:cytochrome b